MGTAPCISPPDDSIQNSFISTVNVCLHVTSDADLHSAIQRFWIQEELHLKSIRSHEETLCDSNFSDKHASDENRRYVVILPFKESHTCLGEYKHADETHLYAMERKFGSNGKFSRLYHEFMDEYYSLGHMFTLTNAGVT